MSKKYMPSLVKFNNGDILLGIYYGKSDELSPWIFTFEEMKNKKGEKFSDKDIYECCEEKDTKYEEEHKNIMKYYPREKDEDITDEEDVEIFTPDCSGTVVKGKASRSKGIITSTLKWDDYYDNNDVLGSISPWVFSFYQDMGWSLTNLFPF